MIFQELMQQKHTYPVQMHYLRKKPNPHCQKHHTPPKALVSIRGWGKHNTRRDGNIERHNMTMDAVQKN